MIVTEKKKKKNTVKPHFNGLLGGRGVLIPKVCRIDNIK